ncbi:WG repeat-containing protein [Capnocytophaga canimorsus]
MGKYDLMMGFSEGLMRVEKNRKCGFIDKKGKVIVPLKYDSHQKA